MKLSTIKKRCAAKTYKRKAAKGKSRSGYRRKR